MSRAGRLWLAVAPAAVAVGVLVLAVIVTSDHQPLPRLQAALVLLGGWSFIAAGLVARTRQPRNRTGLLMIAVGFGWLVGALFASNDSIVWTIGVALSAISGGFLVHLLLAYPSGRLGSAWDRGLVATGYGLTALGPGLFLLVDGEPIEGCDECPSSAILIRDSQTVTDVLTVLVEGFAVVFLLAVVATLVRRGRRSSPVAHRTLAPVLLAGATTLLLFCIHVGTQDLWPDVAEFAGWTASFAFIGVPFLFLSGLLKSRLARADISRALTEGLVERAPDQAQARIQRLLHDPTAELLFWQAGEIRAYIDVQGTRRDIQNLETGRAATPIAREGIALAAIVHDEALLEEPELVEQVAAAVGLEIERDRNLFDLQASERRSRALLEAIPDSMFRISREGKILDYRVEPPVKLFRPEEGLVGSDVYDTDFPAEITARNMALGEEALETGELQVHEYDVEIDGKVRHQEARITRSGPDEFLLIVRDVTERRQQERELQRSERRNRALVEAMPDNMFRISADGIFLDMEVSPDARPVHAKVGSSIHDYPAPPELIDRVMAAGKRTLETGSLETIEWELDERHQEGRFMPSGDNEFFLVVRDVTARKQHELEQAALHRVALAVATGFGAVRIFDLVAEEMGRVLGAHSVSLLRYEPAGDEAIVVGRWIDHEADLNLTPLGKAIHLPGGPLHVVYKTGHPLRVDLDEGDVPPEFAERLRTHLVNSFVAAPITVSGRPWGVVAASLTPPHSFSTGAEDRLGAFTQLVSLALANEEARGQLAASRARLVSAGDEERRRLERNLHDGAQQRLVSVSVSLRLAQARLESAPDSAHELLAAANAELAVALEELRELARGIHPAVLTERGLGPALASLADRAPLPVELEQLPDERLPRQIEAAAYYVVSEALANVAKYAQASLATVRVGSQDGRAVVEVVDDGVGGADSALGSGLRGLTDRVEALEGQLHVESPAGRGTTIRAEMPLGLAPLQDSGQLPSADRESLTA